MQGTDPNLYDASDGTFCRGLDTFHTSAMRRMLGYTRLSHVSNEQLLLEAGQPPMSHLLQRHMLRWAGHVAREPTSSPTHQLMFAHGLPGRVPRSGQRKTWLQWCRSATEGLGMTGRQWFDLAQDRSAWASKIQLPPPQ